MVKLTGFIENEINCFKTAHISILSYIKNNVNGFAFRYGHSGIKGKLILWSSKWKDMNNANVLKENLKIYAYMFLLLYFILQYI
jgi:hypothetical protein